MGDRETARYHWSFPICPTRITIDLSVIRALQQDLLAPGDRHGLLFGKEQEGATHVNGRDPLEDAGGAAVARAAGAARRPPVGYYRIRDGHAFILTSEEIDIARELFKRPGAVMLLIERRAAGAAEATFFFWRGDTFVHNLPHPFPLDAEKLGAGDDAPAPRPRRERTRPAFPLSAKRAGIVAAAVAAGVVVGIFATRAPAEPPVSDARPAVKRAAARPTASIAETAAPVRPGNGLEFVWDPKSMPAATAGLLEIDDGGVKRTIPLDSDQLHTGSVAYEPSSGHVRAALSTLQRDGRILDASVSMRPAAPGAAATAMIPEPLPPISAPAPQPAAKVQQPPPQQTPVETQPQQRAETAASSADRRAPLKPFTLLARRLEAPAQPVSFDPPAIDGVPGAGAPVLPITPVMPPAPAMAPAAGLRTRVPSAPAPTAAHIAATFGRLIWTGTLLRRGVVELNGPKATVGSISGALPGVPVSVSISPAEFGDQGLVVYTTDATRHNRVEPASAATGWNKVTWIWDPERVHEIAVLEPPNQSNGFHRLAFRSDARRTSIVWIDWRAR